MIRAKDPFDENTFVFEYKRTDPSPDHPNIHTLRVFFQALPPIEPSIIDRDLPIGLEFVNIPDNRITLLANTVLEQARPPRTTLQPSEHPPLAYHFSRASAHFRLHVKPLGLGITIPYWSHNAFPFRGRYDLKAVFLPLEQSVIRNWERQSLRKNLVPFLRGTPHAAASNYPHATRPSVRVFG